jgi:predicted TIM-barrel fold metal-dependent hydrolase
MMGLELQGHYRYPPADAAWLAQHHESILEPDLPIIDAHHHLWEEPGNFYLADDLAADCGTGHRIVATIYAQCGWRYRKHGPAHLAPVGEVEAVVQSCPADPRNGPYLAAGIIGFADLTLQADLLEETLAACAQAAPGRFCGIRRSMARDTNFPNGIVIRPAPEGLMEVPVFRQNLRLLGKRGLVFDSMIYHQQLADLAKLVAAVPDTLFVLDHIGTPLGVGPYEGHAAAVFEDWCHGLAAVATLPNVHLKFGGLGMIITGAADHLAACPPDSTTLAARWQPYFDHCLKLFGVQRILFEGNFPVDKAMFSYGVLWNAFKRLASGLSADEKSALFWGNARRLYKLRMKDMMI